MLLKARIDMLVKSLLKKNFVQRSAKDCSPKKRLFRRASQEYFVPIFSTKYRQNLAIEKQLDQNCRQKLLLERAAKSTVKLRYRKKAVSMCSSKNTVQNCCWRHRHNFASKIRVYLNALQQSSVQIAAKITVEKVVSKRKWYLTSRQKESFKEATQSPVE